MTNKTEADTISKAYTGQAFSKHLYIHYGRLDVLVSLTTQIGEYIVNTDYKDFWKRHDE